MTEIYVDTTKKFTEQARTAAQMQARVCLSGCEFCKRVLSLSANSAAVRKVTVATFQVRTECELHTKPVRPPKDVANHEQCPHLLRNKARQSKLFVQ